MLPRSDRKARGGSSVLICGQIFRQRLWGWGRQEAYDPRYGARPLRRWLEHQVVTELSRLVVSGSLQEGGTVAIDATRCFRPLFPFLTFSRPMIVTCMAVAASNCVPEKRSDQNDALITMT